MRELGFLDPETVRDCVCVNVCELGFLDPGTVRVCVCVSVSGVCQCASKGS